MKAVCIRAHGGPDVLQVEEFAQPALRMPRDVRISVHCASVNAADLRARRGASGLSLRFPHVLGRDFSGVVEEAGSDSDLHPGDEVFGVCPVHEEGAYAQLLVIDSGLVARKPPALSHAVAAAFGLAALTAMATVVDTLQVQDGERVLIQGGAGGVGGMAVQLCKAQGAWVAATAREQNHGYVRTLGADIVIDHRRDDVARLLRNLDVGIDAAGGSATSRTFAVLRPGGRAAFLTSSDAPPPPKHGSIRSCRPDVARGRPLLERVLEQVRRERLRPPHITVLPQAEASRAQALAEAGGLRGKIVLEM
ncbi:MAG: NADP-dependent oxidoreductase [Lautropia sp.]